LGALPDVFQKLEAEGLCERGSGAADTAVRVADRVKETSEALGILRALQLKSEATLAAVPDLLRTADEYLVLTESLAAAEKVKVIGPPSAWGRTDLDAIVAAVDFAERIVEGEWPAPLLEAVLSSSCLDALADLRIRTDRGHAEVTQLLGSASVIERLSGDASWTEPNTSLDHLSSRAAASVGAADELAPWSQWLSVRAAITGDGLESLIALFERQQIPASDLLPAFQLAHHSNIVRSLLWESRDSLLSGLDQEEMRKQFRLADREGIRLARVRTAARIAKRQVPAGQQTGPVKTWTELALIVNEISKQRRHIPIRQLVLRAGRALQALKPCFLMGPLSVAQYLPPGGLTFDMVVMDEASQLKPEDAIGAVARGGQLVVVGDPKQLPPTNFFQRVLHDEEDDDEELTVASEGESILDVASALYQPIRRLRWHYRSRHESLIAFSNREFYDGKLFICPSAYDKHLDLGVRYRHVRGVYENRKNALEAAAVADAVADHVRSTSGLSLGVVALNYEQADLLEEVIDRRLADEPEAPAYRELMEERDEPLFVKNLENVQGDERDVIFVSCTYGPDAVGNQYQRFGPVNSADGHRRLNVLFTRAKRRCEVFSSLNPDKINDDGKQRGVRVFKQYLKYAQTGRLESIVDSGQRAAESDFEESVGTLLRQEGYDIRTQIGVSGFWIDIGVRNPAKPGTYVLGIECDGRAYHSGRSARDRDRLRQEILENQGWKIHRIWSTDWFHSRKTAVERLLTRVNQALESDSDYREYRARQQRRDSARALLTTLAEEISREHPGTPPERRLLRGEMFDLFIAKRPVSQPDWFRIPLQLREQTDSTEIRLYLSRVLAIFRDTSE
jgi:very-short-patch-repair endonuclease